jgi:hypothetical protein
LAHTRTRTRAHAHTQLRTAPHRHSQTHTTNNNTKHANTRAPPRAPPQRYEYRPCDAALPPWPREAWDPAAVAAEADAAPRGGLCLFWLAAAPVARGEEACLSYGYLTPDVVRTPETPSLGFGGLGSKFGV